MAAKDWYKDAIIYELHVKTFADSNNDGIGDFSGLTAKLDYLKDLGIDCVWLLPFFQSPLRDDGYDVADYYTINPDYGTLDDFKMFLEAAHKRGIRVVTDLVINHTSDQHAWFQEARRDPSSPKRDYYVWSDTDEPYKDVRIIFIDTEPSNWSWDTVAKQYYWHRFFAHQPDLNFNNEAVQQEILDVMSFWLDMGVDGFRVDAVPYLFETEGTNCENLPETHSYLKKLRQHVDQHYPGRLLIAEANQWPRELAAYFGDEQGPEFQMAFNFPLMTRIFMALALENRQNIVETLEQVPEIPADCQWGIFLRNHDELTLEMVTEDERTFMYRKYAAEPRMKSNLGVRRRLASLLDNEPQLIRLVNSLLFSLAGTPFLYYGDEIGMGDNVYLNDRDGVRTPMQWTGDRNGGFSRADSARLVNPVINDAVYGYQAVNVEAQLRNKASLLNWTKAMIAVRKQYPAFGRGTITFLSPTNPSILAYIRTYQNEQLLIVNNLSKFAQPVELNLSDYKGYIPTEIFGQTAFPAIGDLPYFLTLGSHAFYWFRLEKADQT